ncbi:MAG: PolC-type DNA polymerase III [Bacteroidota bacterium]
MIGNYVVLDLETTGLDYKLEKILEIGAVKMVDGQPQPPFHTLVDPEMEIPNTSIHGIDDSMVMGAPTIQEVLPRFLNYLGDAPIVAHNAIFDFNFLNHNAQSYLQVSVENPLIDTLQIAREVFPQDKSHSLESLVHKLERTPVQFHRALDDTLALADIFPTLWDLHQQKVAWQKAQFERIDFLAQRFVELERLIHALQHEHGEVRRVLQLYFEEGGHPLHTADGHQVFLDRRESWEFCQEELKPLLDEMGLLERVARPEKSRLERWLKGDRLTEEQKERILSTRRFLGYTSKVAVTKEQA